MKEISKKQLVNQILESKKEIDEMADYNPGREEMNPWDETPDERALRGLDPNYFQRKSKVTPLHFERPPASQPESEKTAPDMFVYDDPREGMEGKKIVVVQKPGLTIITEEQLKSENPKFHAWAKSIGTLLFLEVANKIKHDPLEISKANPSKAAMRYRQQLGLEFPEKEATREETPKTRILKYLLNPNIRKLAADINENLINAGLPPIAVPERLFKSQKENIDNYSTIENDNISWETQGTYFYDTVEKYVENAKEKYRGRPETNPPRLTHLVRRYNPGRNWSPTRKTEKRNLGLTPILGLEKGGYSQHDYDVELSSAFSVKGTLTQVGEENVSAFKWTLEYKTFYGKKLREESGIRGGLVEDKFFTTQATTGPLRSLTNGGKSIDSNQQIKAAFEEAIADMKTQIEALDAKNELRGRFTGVGRTDAFREVNESIKIDALVGNIIKELKQ